MLTKRMIAFIDPDFACVPVNLVVPIPDAMRFEQAAFACLGATALQGIRRAGLQLGI